MWSDRFSLHGQPYGLLSPQVSYSRRIQRCFLQSACTPIHL